MVVVGGSGRDGGDGCGGISDSAWVWWSFTHFIDLLYNHEYFPMIYRYLFGANIQGGLHLDGIYTKVI